MNQNTPLLQLKDINAGYTEVPILNELNLQVGAGEIVAIVGANGAGKSTAMRAIFGLLNIFSGQVFFDKQELSKLQPDEITRKGISYVPQVRNIFTELTIHENLEMGGFIRKQGLQQAFDYVYELFPDLVSKKNSLGGNLSGGQRQMLAMARALILQPKLLLLDEPTAGLSPKYMNQIFTIIEQIKKQGKAVLLVEQHAKQALGLCDRGYVLVLGKDKHEGEGKALLNDPKVLASFLGG